MSTTKATRSTQSTWVKRCRSRSEICFKGAKKQQVDGLLALAGVELLEPVLVRGTDRPEVGDRPVTHHDIGLPLARVAGRQVRCAHVLIVQTRTRDR